MSIQHRGLAGGAWFSLSICEQLGNVGSEVGRAASWLSRGKTQFAEGAFCRALELLDLTLADDRWRGARRREIARAREVLCESYLTDDGGAALRSLTRYYDAFALAARASR